MILVKIIFLQIIVAIVILFVLWEMFKRELVKAALQAIEEGEPQGSIMDVSVVTAAALSPVDDSRLRAGLHKKFPSACVDVRVNADIRGGLVIKAGDLLMDHSLLTRIKHLFGQEDT